MKSANNGTKPEKKKRTSRSSKTETLTELQATPSQAETPTEPIITLPKVAREEQTVPLSAMRQPHIKQLNCQKVMVAYSSDVGGRNNNEDSAGAFLGVIPRTENSQELLFGFFAVADGMGGHEKGEVASNLAVRTTLQGVLTEFYIKSVQGLPPGNGSEMPDELLARIIESANNTIVREGAALHASMGTTLTCALMVGSMAYIGHIGDSRMYGLERSTGKLRQLTQDHSMVQRLVETGQMTAQEASESPQRSVLYRSLGQRTDRPADTQFLRLSDYSHLILCSDGMWDWVEEDAIVQFIMRDDDPALICHNLINAVNSVEGDDNITAVVVKL